jgi:hypothetical protein
MPLSRALLALAAALLAALSATQAKTLRKSPSSRSCFFFQLEYYARDFNARNLQ